MNSLDLPGLPPSVLTLCRGALVILLRNIDYERGLCNGTRCLVINISARVLDVLVLTGKSIGKRAFIPRIPLSPSEAMLPVKLIRRQFPVRLAWALTINKAQGQTLRRCGLVLPNPVFAHGQLYVALSRVSSATSLNVLIQDGPGQGRDGNDTYTQNIVYGEVLTA